MYQVGHCLSLKFQTKIVEKIKINIFCPVTIFENSVVYKLMQNDMVDLGRPQMTIDMALGHSMLDTSR